MPWFYYVGRVIIRTLLRLLTSWHVVGKENIPKHGALLIVSNHLNLIDPPLLGVSIERLVIFMAKKELFRFRAIGYLISNLGAFPVHRNKVDRKALHRAALVLSSGLALVMFPEGMRSRTAQLRRAFSGAAFIALRNGVPVLPVGIAGTEKIKGIGWIFRRPRITVYIGRPFLLPEVSGKLDKAKLAGIADYIMQHIADLLPEEYQGDHARRRAAAHED